MASQLIKPPALKTGDTVGVVAPAAAVEREMLERGVRVLNTLGYKVKVSEQALARDGILAGTDRSRAAEVQRFFADPEVDAIFCARGGYGSGRLLPLLDFEAIARTPKIFVAFSDQTFMLNALVARARLVCFHGPMVALDMARGISALSLDHMQRLLAGKLNGLELPAAEVIHPGAAEGEVVGGCLSVVVATLGTPFAPDFADKLLFIEDTGEKAYRIDRMMVQLRQSGALSKVSGVAVGSMRPVNGDEQESRLIRAFLAEQTAGLGCPVLAGLEVGHRTENLTIPLGVRARLDSERKVLSFLEAPVVESAR